MREAAQELTDKHRVISQHDLRDTLNGMPEAVDDIKFHSAWIDGGWESKPATLREGDATIPVILEQHQDTVHERTAEVGAGLAVKEWLVPILPRRDVRVLRRISGYPIVSGVEYDEETGAQ